MLQFIVLGLVPGTHIQITFGWVIAMVCVAGFFWVGFMKIVSKFLSASAPETTANSQA